MAKSKSGCLTMVAVMTVALLFAGGGRVAEGQSDCASKLVPCLDYLSSTKPSSECCDAMKIVVTTQLACLCGLLKNPCDLAGINITQALELPKYCNIPSDTSACNAAQSPGFSSSLPPPVMKKPTNLAKHQGNPKVAPIIAKMMSKFAGPQRQR